MTKAAIMTDSKNCFDVLKSESSCLGQKDKRTGIELLEYRMCCEEDGTVTRWVAGESQLANSLTKSTEPHQLDLFLKLGCRWKIVDDPLFQSARKRKAKGLEALQSE